MLGVTPKLASKIDFSIEPKHDLSKGLMCNCLAAGTDIDASGTASSFYSYERGTTVYSSHPTYWVGKIGLMYPSDYGYATHGGTTTNRYECLGHVMYSWNQFSECYNNDYLYDSSFHQWTLTPASSYSYSAFLVYVDGYVRDGYVYYSSNSVSPVLYLKSTVQITGGEGTSENPFIDGV